MKPFNLHPNSGDMGKETIHHYFFSLFDARRKHRARCWIKSAYCNLKVETKSTILGSY
jgi:hypothetical protein